MCSSLGSEASMAAAIMLLVSLVAFLDAEASTGVQCDFKGPFLALRSVNGRGSGGYCLIKTTESNRPNCSYVRVPEVLTEGCKVKFTFGNLRADKNQRRRHRAYVRAEGDKIIVTGVFAGTSRVLFSDYKTCDVALGPSGFDYQLWVHADNVRNNSNPCCEA